ncbi:hypothetical protein OROGR_001437 [Orobanche gracilis]
MSETSRSRVTITLGGAGQVVKRDFSALHSLPVVGSKRSIRDRLGNNVDSSANVNNKRLHRDGRSTNTVDDIHLSRDDLRHKIMQKNSLKRSQNSQPNGMDLRDILSRPAQSSTNSITTMDRIPEPKDLRLRYSEPTDGRLLLPMTRNSSQHMSEYRVEQSPDHRKQYILESRGSGQSPDHGKQYIPETKDVRHRVPEPRVSNAVPRMESGINPYSAWTLDRLRQRSPDEPFANSRGPVAVGPERDEIMQRKLAVGAYDDVRAGTYVSKDALEISRPVNTSQLTKMAPPVGQMKTMAPVTSSMPLPVSLMQKSSYMVDEQVTVDSFLRSLGLEKYAILFKAEEVDMYSLKRMAEGDLKEMGIPMGPRKKILLSLQPRLKQQA